MAEGKNWMKAKVEEKVEEKVAEKKKGSPLYTHARSAKKKD